MSKIARPKTPFEFCAYPVLKEALEKMNYNQTELAQSLGTSQFTVSAWARGDQPLEPTNIVEPTATWCPSGSYSHKHGEQHKGMFTTDRAKNRAKTFPGIAKAMAEQWGGDIREDTAE